ncbi:hypothetical protein PsorP6_013952 [Peronosclerospora sorghi]|uniref:Uncharacterized protein n=1 Tax=Peronosclerospora sorghi TaxID=230839 RepID=A0ACC0VGI9_9STRA|nr:hypothetical protein PsorP6_013952 [Peronosclerospora sorghi]
MEPVTDMTNGATTEQALPMPVALETNMATETVLDALPMPEITAIESKESALPQETPTKLLEMSFESPIMHMPLPVKDEEKIVANGSSDTLKKNRKNLTDQQRVAIVHYLLANSAAGRLKHGDMKAAATHFGVHRATIRRLWKLHTASSTTDSLANNVASRIKGHSGRKPKIPDEELKLRIAAIPAERRMTGRGLSTALNVSNSVVVRLIKSGKLRRHPKKLHYIM